MERASLHVRIARRIAACEGVDAAALDPPLHAVVDGDALEKLIGAHPHERRDFTGTVSFTYRDYTVTVDHTGAVSVAPSATGSDRAAPVSKSG